MTAFLLLRSSFTIHIRVSRNAKATLVIGLTSLEQWKIQSSECSSTVCSGRIVSTSSVTIDTHPLITKSHVILLIGIISNLDRTGSISVARFIEAPRSRSVVSATPRRLDEIHSHLISDEASRIPGDSQRCSFCRTCKSPLETHRSKSTSIAWRRGTEEAYKKASPRQAAVASTYTTHTSRDLYLSVQSSSLRILLTSLSKEQPPNA